MFGRINMGNRLNLINNGKRDVIKYLESGKTFFNPN